MTEKKEAAPSQAENGPETIENLAIDSLSRTIRARLKLSTRVESCQG